VESLRTPLLILAIVLIAVAFLLEAGSRVLLGASLPIPGVTRPGLGIPYLALLDALVLFTAALIGVEVFIPKSLSGRVQGCATGVVSLLVLIAAIGLIFTAIALLILMVGLLLAPIFGTIAYFILFGFFDRTAASVTLGLTMLLKIGFAVCLVLAQQRFLQNRGLVLIIATSLVASVIVSFLQGLVPIFLVSITDDVAAIIVGILAAIWAIVFLVGAIPAILKALRSTA
jgi:hypothetical protein